MRKDRNNTIRLTEDMLVRMIQESINEAVDEGFWNSLGRRISNAWNGRGREQYFDQNTANYMQKNFNGWLYDHKLKRYYNPRNKKQYVNGEKAREYAKHEPKDIFSSDYFSNQLDALKAELAKGMGAYEAYKFAYDKIIGDNNYSFNIQDPEDVDNWLQFPEYVERTMMKWSTYLQSKLAQYKKLGGQTYNIRGDNNFLDGYNTARSAIQRLCDVKIPNANTGRTL